jgi:transcriptional regulator of met regulon
MYPYIQALEHALFLVVDAPSSISLAIKDVGRIAYRSVTGAAYTRLSLSEGSWHEEVGHGHRSCIAAAQMDGYLIEERLLDHIMIQVIDKGDGNLEIAFDERDRRYLSQFSAAQLADWLHEAMLHVEAACPLETRDGKPAWIADEAPPRARASIKAMRPARQEHDLPAGLEFLRRT